MAKGAIIYARVSTAIQSEEGSSLETQITAALALADSLNVPVLKVYKEIYTGAELYDRPMLSEVRQEMKNGHCSHLIAHSVDRLARNPIHTGILVMECERYNVDLQFVTEPIDATPEGALILYVKGYAAQLEREKIRERCVRGKRAVAVSGKIHRSGTDLYGYFRQDGKRLINETEAVVVRHIFNEMVNGNSIRQVTYYLNNEGIPPPSIDKRVYRDNRKPVWGKSTVTRILREPSYKGIAMAWRWTSKKVGGRQLMKLRPEQEHIKLPEGTTPALVSTQTWESAQQAIKANGAIKKRSMSLQYLLRGRVFCKTCGKPCYSEASKGVRYYRCGSRAAVGAACGARVVNAEKCERQMWADLEGFITKPENVLMGLNAKRDTSQQIRFKAELKNAKRQLAKCEASLQKLVHRWTLTSSLVLMKTIEAETKAMEAECQRWATKIGELGTVANGEDRAGKAIETVNDALRVMKDRLPQMGFEERQNAFRAFRGRVEAAGKEFRLSIDLSAIVRMYGSGNLVNGPQHSDDMSEMPEHRIDFEWRKAA